MKTGTSLRLLRSTLLNFQGSKLHLSPMSPPSKQKNDRHLHLLTKLFFLLDRDWRLLQSIPARPRAALPDEGRRGTGKITAKYTEKRYKRVARSRRPSSARFTGRTRRILPDPHFSHVSNSTLRRLHTVHATISAPNSQHVAGHGPLARSRGTALARGHSVTGYNCRQLIHTKTPNRTRHDASLHTCSDMNLKVHFKVNGFMIPESDIVNSVITNMNLLSDANYYINKTCDWEEQLPNLLDVFRAEEIDWLLSEATRIPINPLQLQRFIKFVARTGFKDEPKLDEAGKPISRRVTAVHIAAASGLNVIRDLFEIYHRFDVNFTCEHGITHFHLACEFGLDDVAKKFLDLGQDPNLLVKNTGDSPLHYAVAINYDDTTKVVELLLRRGASPNLANNAGQTPLHNFSMHTDDAHVDLAKFFFKICDELRWMVPVSIKDKSGSTPLHWAVKCRNKKLVELLLKRSANPNFIDQDGSTPLHYICEKVDDDDLAKMLFKFCDENNRRLRLDVQNKLGNTPLHEAVECGDKKVVELLLRRGPSPNLANAKGSTPLHIISNNDDSQGLAELFFKICDDLGQTVWVDARDKEDLDERRQQTAQIDARDKSGNVPLHLALEYHNNKLVELLLRRGADQSLANNYGGTPLHLISNYIDDEDDELVELFFEIWDERQQTARVDVQDEEGNTPLHEAVNWGNKKVVEKLLRRGANANLATNYGMTPLHIICCNRDAEDDGLAKLIFDICDERQLKLQVDAANECGYTPLHFVLYNHGDPRLIELLLRRGANPNLVNERGMTPLHMICMRASSRDELLEMFPRLAQLEVVDKLGRTPLRWAVENLVPRVVDVLLDYGADLSSFVFPTASVTSPRSWIHESSVVFTLILN
ncbi:unnamed protein product [Trichogramma brassicae]|uniref:Uncharacterized protein n=1 Tax=Trichogramma brassicae TaxID=86971 RepID=A0A6H5IA96_9HYME|nr:unnamed protein product [Trichogramma brassicae]